jgi:hypothetical protein
METWNQIKRCAINMSVERKQNGKTVEEMVKDVRLLLKKTGFEFTGPVETSQGVYEFKRNSETKLSYYLASNEWI